MSYFSINYKEEGEEHHRRQQHLEPSWRTDQCTQLATSRHTLAELLRHIPAGRHGEYRPLSHSMQFLHNNIISNSNAIIVITLNVQIILTRIHSQPHYQSSC